MIRLRHLRSACRCWWRVANGQPAGTVQLPAGNYTIPGTIRVEGNVALSADGGCSMEFESMDWEGPAPWWVKDATRGVRHR